MAEVAEFDKIADDPVFQHTATRRWLIRAVNGLARLELVSTHSHPKVAEIISRLL